MGAGLNLKILNERLNRLISGFANSAMEARQVSKRLNDLLPLRFGEIKRGYSRAKNGNAERQALTDLTYLSYLDELVEVSNRAREARVQYETHTMLFKARQTLRAFHR